MSHKTASFGSISCGCVYASARSFMWAYIYIGKDVRMACLLHSRLFVCKLGWLVCFLVCLHVCFCWVLTSASPEIGVWRIRHHHRDSRGEATEKKQTKNTHPHAYTLWRNAHCRPEMGEVWLTDAADIRMNRYPSFPSSEAAKTHSDSSEAKPPTLQHGASQLTTHTQIHLLSLSVSPNLLLNGGLCILELMFSPSVYLSLLFSLSLLLQISNLHVSLFSWSSYPFIPSLFH